MHQELKATLSDVVEILPMELIHVIYLYGEPLIKRIMSCGVKLGNTLSFDTKQMLTFVNRIQSEEPKLPRNITAVLEDIALVMERMVKFPKWQQKGEEKSRNFTNRCATSLTRMKPHQNLIDFLTPLRVLQSFGLHVDFKVLFPLKIL
jgi:hypothetical protein